MQELGNEEALRLLLLASTSLPSNLPLPFVHLQQALDLSSPPHATFFTPIFQPISGVSRWREITDRSRSPSDEQTLETFGRKRKNATYGVPGSPGLDNPFSVAEIYWSSAGNQFGVAIEMMTTASGAFAKKYTLVQSIHGIRDINHLKKVNNTPCLINLYGSSINKVGSSPYNMEMSEPIMSVPDFMSSMLNENIKNPFEQEPYRENVTGTSSNNSSMRDHRWDVDREQSFEGKSEAADFVEVVGLMSPRESSTTQQNSSVEAVGWDSSSYHTMNSTHPSARNSPVSARHLEMQNQRQIHSRVPDQLREGSTKFLNSPNVQTFGRNTIVKGNLIVDGKGLLANVHVKGNLTVEGEIRGKLVTEAGKADYAEWFNFLDTGGKVENIGAGDVVQLRSPQQRITLDTSHADCGPILVVSTSPSVAAGKPDNDEPGAFCAFLGQVPVKVHGPVACGDLLFPSGLNDGYAVSHVTHYDISATSKGNKAKLNDNRHEVEPIATAIEDCAEGDHVILSFVRWQHNVKDQMLRKKTKKLNNSVTLVWMTNMILLFDYLISCSFYFSPNHHYFQFEKILLSTDLILMAFFVYNLLNIEYKELFQGNTLPTLLCFKILRLFISVYSCVCLLTVEYDTTLNHLGLLKNPPIDVNIHSKRLFVNSIHILSSVMFVVMILNFVDAWRTAYPEESKHAVFFSTAYSSVAKVVEMFPNSMTNQTKRLEAKKKKKN